MYNNMSPLSSVADENLVACLKEELVVEIKLFRKALKYCYSQRGDDHCFMDYRHLLMRFFPGYDPDTDDVILAEDQLDNCRAFIKCWQQDKDWDCLGGDKGKTVRARTIGTLDCLEDQ